MTTTHTVPDTEVPPGERGSTSIAERVVAKIAAQAAREALFRGVPTGGDVPHAVVTVHKNHARIRIGVDLDFPSDIGTQCGAVRLHVSERVNHLTGMLVPEVRVHVERLHSVYSREAGGRPR